MSRLDRIEERLHALKAEVNRERKTARRALMLASGELARRLDDLNHAHAKAVERESKSVTVEKHEGAMREVDVRLKNLEGAGREQQGRLWLPLLVTGAVALGIGAALVRALVK